MAHFAESGAAWLAQGTPSTERITTGRFAPWGLAMRSFDAARTSRYSAGWPEAELSALCGKTSGTG